MSLSAHRRHLALAAALAAIAIIAACDSPSPTQPQLRTTRKAAQPKVLGDTSQCTHGWDIVQGWYVCR
jgi:hypothetical protein